MTWILLCYVLMRLPRLDNSINIRIKPFTLKRTCNDFFVLICFIRPSYIWFKSTISNNRCQNKENIAAFQIPFQLIQIHSGISNSTFDSVRKKFKLLNMLLYKRFTSIQTWPCLVKFEMLNVSGITKSSIRLRLIP